MFESYAALLLSEHLYGATFEPPIGASGDRRLLDPNARPVKTRDGYICITTNTDAQVMALFDALGRPELKAASRFNTAVRRTDHIAEFFQIRHAALPRPHTPHCPTVLARHQVPAIHPHNH